jgi:hypothetical protein
MKSLRVLFISGWRSLYPVLFPYNLLLRFCLPCAETDTRYRQTLALALDCRAWFRMFSLCVAVKRWRYIVFIHFYILRPALLPYSMFLPLLLKLPAHSLTWATTNPGVRKVVGFAFGYLKLSYKMEQISSCNY